MVKTRRAAAIDSTSAPDSIINSTSAPDSTINSTCVPHRLQQDLREFERTNTVPCTNTLNEFSAICQRHRLKKKNLWPKLSDGHRQLVATAEARFGENAVRIASIEKSPWGVSLLQLAQQWSLEFVFSRRTVADLAAIANHDPPVPFGTWVGAINKARGERRSKTLAKKGVCFDTSLTPHDIQEARTTLNLGRMAPKTRVQASPSPRGRRPPDSNSLAHAPSPAKRLKTEGAPLSPVSRKINPTDDSQDAAFQPESSAVNPHTEGDEQVEHDKEQGVQPPTVEGETHLMDQDSDSDYGLLGEDGTAAVPTEVGRHEPHSESFISEDEVDFTNDEVPSVEQSRKLPTPAMTLLSAGPTRPNSSQPFAAFSPSHKEGKSGFSPTRPPRHRPTSSNIFKPRATRLPAPRPPGKPPKRINPTFRLESTFQPGPSQTRAHLSTPIPSSSRHNPEKDANSMYQPDASRFQDGEQLSDNEVWQVLDMFKGLGCRFLAISSPDDDDWDKWSSVQSRPFSSDKKARMVVAPLCRRNHWILFCLHVETGQVDFFDSVRSKDTPYSHIGRAILRACGTSSRQDTLAASDCPQQQGSTDCGIFILAECFYLLAQRTFPKEIDAEVWRRILQFALIEEESIEIAALVPQLQNSGAVLATELVSWYQKAKKALQSVAEHENAAFEASAIISQICTTARKQQVESPDDEYDDAGRLANERIAMREDLLQQLTDLSPEKDDANDIKAVQALGESIALRKQQLKDVADERAKHAKQVCRIERLSQAVQDMRLRLGMKGAELRGKIRSVGLLMEQIGRASAG